MANPKNFMWEFQEAFLGDCRILIELMRKELGCQLEHSMFLLGFRVSRDPRFREVCVEPEECPYQPALFDDIYKDAARCCAMPPNTSGYAGEQGCAAGEAGSILFLRKMWEGVPTVVRTNTDGPAKEIYASFPCQVNRNYVVCLVLQIARKDYEALPHLQKPTVEGKNGAHFYVETSFMAAVVNIFLDHCRQELTKRDREGGLPKIRDPKELLRLAGRTLMLSAAFCGSVPFGFRDLFETCNNISSLRYEGAEGAGRLIFAQKGHPALDLRIEFTHPPKLDKYRAVRKLMQLCDRDTCLLSHSNVVYGLGGVRPGAYDPGRQDLFEIRFVSHHCWDLVHDVQVLMRTTYGEPGLPKKAFDEGLFATELRRVVPDVSVETLDEFIRLARKASEAKHGTMLVISRDAAAEADRLQAQAYGVRPLHVSGEQLSLAASIDGAILL